MPNGRPTRLYEFPVLTSEERRNRFFNSTSLDVMFRKGMALVEETAAYLDGPGRAAAAELEQSVQRVYTEQCMALTNRLMTAASWLLILRNVKADGMSIDHLNRARQNIDFKALEARELPTSLETLPEPLRDLIHRSLSLAGEIRRLDLAHFPRTGANL